MKQNCWEGTGCSGVSRFPSLEVLRETLKAHFRSKHASLPFLCPKQLRNVTCLWVTQVLEGCNSHGAAFLTLDMVSSLQKTSQVILGGSFQHTCLLPLLRRCPALLCIVVINTMQLGEERAYWLTCYCSSSRKGKAGTWSQELKQ